MIRIKRSVAAESCSRISCGGLRLTLRNRFLTLKPYKLTAHLPAGAAFSVLCPAQGYAAELLSLPSALFDQNPNMAGMGVFIGLVLFATVTSIVHIGSRQRWIERESDLVRETNELRIKLDRAHVFLSSEPQIVVVWGNASGEPDIEGDISLVSELPIPRRVLGFGSWLPPDLAQEIENSVDRLRNYGESFRMALQTVQGRHLEAEGRAIAGRAILRICDVSGDRLELTRLRDRHTRVMSELSVQRTLMDALPNASWLRDHAGRLVWVNRAYARAVEAKDTVDVLSRNLELLDESAREQARESLKEQKTWHQRITAVIAGERHPLDVIDVPGLSGTAGFANDLYEVETAKSDLRRLNEAHARTLDQLQTAVAIFDGSKQLVFYNSAYRQLWSLDTAFLDQKPTDGEVLDRLRAEQRLPEQADFRGWKQSLLAAYHSVEPHSHSWFLPDGRTLRVVTNPNSQGGVTYLFDDVTQAYNLQWKFNALNRMQSETLDTLQEGVAVFGSDGKLNLYNPALANLWRLDLQQLDAHPHVDAFARACALLLPDPDVWSQLRGAITGLAEARVGFKRRMNCSNGKVLDCTLAPLPDGATLVTFSDVSATVEVERALTDRNTALVEAETLRNNFVHHVSYELRSPLTSIIGFIQMLGEERVGSLNAKQREYLDHVTKSSDALMAIIDNILDLASIDAGAMELKREEVDIAATIDAAAMGVRDRLDEASLRLDILVTEDIGTFMAEAKRLKQILFNLLSNAIGFSVPGQTITLAASRENDAILIRVSDQGRGIPSDVLDNVFDRLSTHNLGSRYRGVGLGLSIVRSFVELHGGKVKIDSAPQKGTSITCIFPTPKSDIKQKPAAVSGSDEVLVSTAVQSGARQALPLQKRSLT